jgi:adenine-specific DNA-methyltransferase
MNKLKQKLEKILKQDKSFVDSETGEVDYMKVKDSADSIDEKLISLLASDKEMKKKFFSKIKDVYVFNINDFKFFLDESKLDNSYTKYANKIGLSDTSELLRNRNEVVLDFPFKDCVLEGGQSTEEGMDEYFEFNEKDKKYQKKESKRKEVFFNQVLAHDEIDRLFDKKALVNWKRFVKGGNKNGEAVKELKRDVEDVIRENLIIKGNNLLALHSLKSEFAGQIKLIYIDPPYNTENDSFVYNDNFNHSTWLTFMSNRLQIAKELLNDNGVIVVQCDDGEQAYLKVLMDEVFPDNFLNCVAVKMSESKGLKNAHIEKRLPKNKEYLLFYTKDKKHFTFNPQRILKEKVELIGYVKYYKKWIPNIDVDIEKWRLEKFDEKSNKVTTIEEKLRYGDKLVYLVKPDNEIKLKVTEGKFARIKNRKGKETVYYNNDGKILTVLFLKQNIHKFIGDLWTDISTININKEGGEDVLSNGQKPEKLIQRIVEMTTEINDIILDYHLGSGTTCAVAHKLNRQFIGVEQLDYIETTTIGRMSNVLKGEQGGISKEVSWKGGGEFVYCELAKWNEKAKAEINKAENLKALEKLFDSLFEKYFLNYNVRIKNFKEKVIKENNFKKLTLAEQKRMFLTMLDLNQMYVQESEMADKRFGISKDDQELTKEFYKNK